MYVETLVKTTENIQMKTKRNVSTVIRGKEAVQRCGNVDKREKEAFAYQTQHTYTHRVCVRTEQTQKGGEV